MDWGTGSYELTAAQLAPASEVAVDALQLAEGHHVLDVACGTGNAALAAGRRGAEVTGLDGAPRLLDVARQRAAEEGVTATWVHGDLGALPFPDDSFDSAVSVFGVIFAGDPDQATAELLRVVRPGGRVVLATWPTDGPLAEIMRLSLAARAEVAPAPPARVDWADADHLSRLLAPAQVTTERRTLHFTSTSPRAYVDEQAAHHPGWLTLGAALPEQRFARLLADMTAVLERANDDPAALRISVPYVIATAVLPA